MPYKTYQQGTSGKTRQTKIISSKLFEDAKRKIRFSRLEIIRCMNFLVRGLPFIWWSGILAVNRRMVEILADSRRPAFFPFRSFYFFVSFFPR